MHAKIELPKAFSVRDEHEFLPIQHLMARLNPKLVVKQVATGMHINGGPTVFWGVVYLDGEPPSRKEVENALREAGFDFAHKVLTQAAFVWIDHAGNPALMVTDPAPPYRYPHYHTPEDIVDKVAVSTLLNCPTSGVECRQWK